MRIALITTAAAALALAACQQPTQPVPTPVAQNTKNMPSTQADPNLNRFVQPTNGAAYSQSEMYYYTNDLGTVHEQGPSGFVHIK